MQLTPVQSRWRSRRRGWQSDFDAREPFSFRVFFGIDLTYDRHGPSRAVARSRGKSRRDYRNEPCVTFVSWGNAMTTLHEIFTNMSGVRDALISRYDWFVHITPLGNLPSIRGDGLTPKSDASPPPEVAKLLGETSRTILCLHPLGAKLKPLGTQSPPFASLAVRASDLPERMGLDWSYSWPLVEGRMELYSCMPMREFVQRIADEFGSVVSYDAIASARLRVCGQGNSLNDPSNWPMLDETPGDKVLRWTHANVRPVSPARL
jgi:hypothetical protein